MELKQCTKCKEKYPATTEYFYKQKRTKDGLAPWCKKCRLEYQKKYQNEHKEEQKKRHAIWHIKNREIVLQRNKEFREANKEHVREYQRKYQKENRDKYKIYRKQKVLHRNHRITKQEWEACKAYFNYSCAYCGMTENEHKALHNEQLHKEHVIHNGANDLSNCVPACKHCNSQKWEYSLDEWYNENNKVFSKERLDKINKWLKEDYKKYIKNKINTKL